MVKAIRVLYDNSRSAVMVNGMLSNRFEITTGVLQRDVLAPYLFVIVIDHVLVTATTQCQSGLVTQPRQSRRHPVTVLNDLDFADDICPFECSTCSAQAQINSTASAATQVGLKISVPKAEYMMYNIPSPGNLQADGEDIKQVSNFCYLGSLVADRMDSSQPAHIYALYCPPHGRRRPGSQHINYLRYIQECLGDYLGMLTPSQICKLAMDRTAWRKAVVDCCAAEG